MPQVRFLASKHIGILIGLCLLTYSSAFAATTYPQPYIQNFTPSNGAAGTLVTVNGSGFTGLTKAWLGSAHDATVHVISNTRAVLTVPKDATTGQFALFNPQHVSFSATKFTIAGSGPVAPPVTGSPPPSSSGAKQPYIINFSPFSGPAGTVITVNGKGFTGLSKAWIGPARDAAVRVINDTAVQVTVPADAVNGQIGLLNSAHASFSATAFLVTKSLTGGTPPVSVTNSSPPPSTGGGTTTVPSGPAPSIKVSGDHFVDASGKTVQLRGANVSGLEFVAVQGWDPASPWGGQVGGGLPDWNAMKSWDINVVRLPLNEASWLGYQCVDAGGATRNPDPGHNYQATVKQSIAGATAAGLYVIIDLHWTAPKNFCPLAQNPMADADNSLNFWNSVATTFKGYPNVLFELFNEPYVYWLESPGTEWQTTMQGGGITQYVTGGTPYQVAYNWKAAGMQQMLDTVRATGATNPVLVAGVNWAGDLSQWLANAPTDPLKQMAAVWHAYPAYGTTFGTAAYALPGGGLASYANALSIISAGIPVVITESGDKNAPGTSSAPFEAKLLPWADKAGASYLGWAWDVWQNTDNVLIKDATGTPTDGYGAYFKQHLLCAATSTNCR